ncbi:PREDICTED: transmembrane protein 238 [Myotis davidii]|uniref:transmembrane protein 238 n=1 Tax=Myotis davidii TaxID=225400 RepID=UPI0003EC203A|nr:PREDICTED: transmembrane protein 238 [Myotis davidii]
MELSSSSELEAERLRCLGRCRHFFWLGVAFDTVGATALLVGIFSDFMFYDLLLYLGSIIIFLSLLWWVFWYTGNIELSPEDTWKRPIHMGALSQHVSLTLNITSNLARIRRGQRRRRLLESAASILSRNLLTTQASMQIPEEDQNQDGMTSVRTSSEAEDVGREDLGPEPEAVQHSERVRFSLSTQSQPLTPSIVSSKSLPVVPSPSVSQPLRICYSTSLPTSLASTNESLDTVASENLPGVPLYSTGQPLDTLASDTQTAAFMASQRQPLVHEAAQSHFQGPGDPARDFQNHSLASHTQPPPVQAFQTQTLASQVPLTQLTPAPFFQTQPVDPSVTLAVQDFQALYNTQQAPMSTAVVQETELSQSSHAQEPSEGQELSQEVPDTVSPLPESLALATEAQQSMPHESAPAPTTQNSRHF